MLSRAETAEAVPPFLIYEKKEASCGQVLVAFGLTGDRSAVSVPVSMTGSPASRLA